MSFRDIRLADFEQHPTKRARSEPAQDAPHAVFPNGNVVATHPIHATVLPPRPSVLTELDSAHSGATASCGCDLDPSTGWAMISAPDGVRLWPVRGTKMDVTPLLFKSDSPMLPLFVPPEQGSNQPEIVLINRDSGEILHFRRISFALTEQPATISLALRGDTVIKATACGPSVVVATSLGHLYLVRLRDGFGAVGRPTVHRMSKSWFNWGEPEILDLASHKNITACLRSSGVVSLYSIGATSTLLQDINLKNLKIKGVFLGIALDGNTLYVLTVNPSTTEYLLSRVFIDNGGGVLELQHIIPDIQSKTAKLFVAGDTKYILFDHQLVVMDWQTEEFDSNMTLHSLVKTAKSLKITAPTTGILYFQDHVTVYGSKGFGEGCMLLTSTGVLEVDSAIQKSDVKVLLEQAVFNWSKQSPVTFAPAVQIAAQAEGDIVAVQAAVDLAHDIASSVKVPPVPNIESHLELRVNCLKELVQFSLKALNLNDYARVTLQNIWEQLETVRHLVDLVPKLSSSPNDWLLYRTDRVAELLAKCPKDRAISALCAALHNCSPSLVQPGLQNYWLASPKLLKILKDGDNTPEHAELVCTSLVYASADGSVSGARAQQEENLLLRDLASRGHAQQATDIARKLELWSPLAILSCNQWLDGLLPFDSLAEVIDELGYDFAKLLFDHLKSIDQGRLITTAFVKYPDFVYRYFDDEPRIQWAMDRLNGNTTQATQTLAKACENEKDGPLKLVLASLLRLQSVCENDFQHYNQASHELAIQRAKSRVIDAPKSPSSPGFASIVKNSNDILLQLTLLPASATNYICAINLLEYGASDSLKRLLAQQIIVNTDWTNINESQLLYQVLWSPLIDETGVKILEPFLIGDLKVGTDDVNELFQQPYKAKAALDIATCNNKLQRLPEDSTGWIRGALNRPTSV